MSYELVFDDCFTWMEKRERNSVQAIVTDPPYAVVEFSAKELTKMRNGQGGIWRIPPKIGGIQRRAMPRFTVLTQAQLDALHDYFYEFSKRAYDILVPGAYMFVASTPLLSYIVASAVVAAGYERRGEIIRLGLITMRGGDRPKNAEKEFPQVSVMPRGAYEPWLLFRKPISESTVAANLRRWKTGGLQRPEVDSPFFDVIHSAKTDKQERAIADHPSIKPQAFMREICHAALPLGEGIVLDPFMGSGATIAACAALDYDSIGIERDEQFFEMAVQAVPELAQLGRQEQLETLPLFGDGKKYARY